MLNQNGLIILLLVIKLIKYFEGRGISQKSLVDLKVGEGLEWMPQTKKEVNTIQFHFL